MSMPVSVAVPMSVRMLVRMLVPMFIFTRMMFMGMGLFVCT
jgi:hypothetical protein